jgi:pimeloyl-ACP methyl ester carboxylesterase
MTTTTATWTEETVEVAGVSLALMKGGSGSPLLILHDELGQPGWLRYHEALAQQHTLYMPLHPGFGKTAGLEWVLHVRDLAGWYLDALDELGVGRLPVIGLGFGGWLAACMASMCPHQFEKLIIVSAPGIKPPEGEIFDMFLVVAKQYITASFFDPDNTAEYQQFYGANPPPPEQAEAWEVAREMASRLTWRPYMHDPSLPYLLRRLRHLPSLIIWGRQDAIVPLSAAQAYQAAIPGSRLEVLDHCGHHPEIEQADTFVRLVQEFLRAA